MNVHGDDIAALKPAKPKRQRTNRLFVEDNECCQALCDLNFTYEELENNLASAYDGSRYGRYRFARVTVQLMSWRQTKKGQKPVLRHD
jgi:hypothetical protein